MWRNGARCREIADELHLAVGTVAYHLRDSWIYGLRTRKYLKPRSDSYRDSDFSPTPIKAVEMLMEAEEFTGTILDPCAGRGDLARTLARRNDVTASDVALWSYGVKGMDFYDVEAKFDNVVFHPPKRDLQRMAFHAKAVARRKVVILCDFDFLFGKGIKLTKSYRRGVFQPNRKLELFQGEFPLARVLIPSRQRFMDFAWMVWERGHVGPTVIKWI